MSDDTSSLPSSEVIFNNASTTPPCSTIPYSLNNAKQNLRLPWWTKENPPQLQCSPTKKLGHLCLNVKSSQSNVGSSGRTVASSVVASSLNVEKSVIDTDALKSVHANTQGLLNIHVSHYCMHGWFLVTVCLHSVALANRLFVMETNFIYCHR